ncbi:T9SS type A sorting domain-containing protein [Flavobacteriaceae bacterium]|nr:T9SS type A sorting domain-containing protein [Flavobacteriaceae bacterium]MDB9912872.1 T9SS type A sorting domain-containing protein [Flavobacteriaceae bacterium]
MKNIFLTLFTIAVLIQTTKAQTDIPCEQKTWVVNVGSIEDHIDIYHSGHYLTSPREENVITWTVTDNQGTIITQETLIDEAHFDFYHDIPTTDTMNISALLINEVAGVACFVEDVLFWDTNNRWEFLNGNVPILGANDSQLINFKITSTLIDHYIEIRTAEDLNLIVYDKRGISIKNRKITTETIRLPMDDVPSGIYFVQLSNDQNSSQTIKILKK